MKRGLSFLTSDEPTIAFAILAHGSLTQLNVFIEQLLSYKNSYVFLHIDKKARFGANSVISNDRIRIISRQIDASWGDISLVDISLELLKSIGEDDIQFDWVSMHSGLDLAVRPVDDFARMVSSSSKAVYMDASKLPIVGWGRSGGFERLALVYPGYMRKRPTKYGPSRYLRHVYQLAFAAGLVKGRPLLEGVDFYGGSQWLTFQGDIASEILQYISSNGKFYSFFKDALISDEIFLPTIINILYKDRKDIIEYDNNLRYIDWSIKDEKNIGSPKTLTIDDTQTIINSGAYFARKFNISSDNDVVDFFKKRIRGENLDE